MNLLASVTKGFELLNDLLENFKLYTGKEGGIGADMMDFTMGRGGFDEEMLGMMSMSGSKGMMKRMM